MSRCATVVDRLIYARVERELSQRALSLSAGLSDSVVNKLEKGQTPKYETAEKLAVALRVPLEWLWLGLGPVPVFKPAPPPESTSAATAT